MNAPRSVRLPTAGKRWLKWTGLALGALLVLLCLALVWLLTTSAGLRFALTRAHGFTHGALSVQQADGRLVGPLQLHGVRYVDGSGLDARIASVRLDLGFWSLLREQVHVQALRADGVVVTLPPASTEPQGGSGFSLNPPVDIVIDQAHVGTVRVHRAGALLFASDQLDLAGRWSDAGVVIRQLALRAPDGHVDLHGTLVLGAQRKGDAQAAFAWKLGETTYAGQLQAHSDGRATHANLALTRPAAAHLQLQLDQQGANAWTAALAVPAFDPHALLGPDSALHSLAVDLHGRGDRHGGTLAGPVTLDDTTLRLQPLRAQLSDDLGTLQLQQLVMTSPQIPGELAASGTVHLDAQPVSARLVLHWKEVQLPAQLVGQALASSGQLAFDGSATHYQARGRVHIGPPGKLADLALDLDGNPQRIALHTLDLRQPQGRFHAAGTVTLQPVTGWQLALQASHFDPGQLFAGWTGALDADLSSHGTLAANGPDATMQIATLGGRLRGQPVHGHGSLHLSPAKVVDGTLQLASGNNTVHVQGRPGSSNDVHVRLALDALHDWLPDAHGRLDGTAHVQGRWRALGVDADLRGHGLAWQRQRAGAIHLTAHVPDITAPEGTVALDARDVFAGGLGFASIDLHGAGTRARHRLRLDAKGDQLDATLALDGSLKAGRWSGTLTTLDLQPQGLPGWRLEQPTELAYQAGAMSLGQLCLTAGDPRLCVQGKRDAAGSLDASYRLRALPIAMLLNAAGYAQFPLRADGTLEGSGTVHRSAAGVLGGNASLRSAQGSVTYTRQAQRPLLAWHDLVAQADLGAGRQQITLSADLSDGGRLDGHATVSGAQQALAGQVTVQLNSLAPLELATAELANVGGALNAHFRLGGTLPAPQLEGQASVSAFAAEVPRLGLKLSHGQLVARTTGARRLDLQGSVQSGKGTLAIGGTMGLSGEVPTRITLGGKQITVADIPAARVVVSPQLVLAKSARGIDATGTLAVDSAKVDLDRLRGIAGANGVRIVASSPDVVVVDEKQQEKAEAQLPVTARITVDLGHRTRITGMGLNGTLHGSLTVIDQPGHPTSGQGQITVNGTYKAYGQDLVIEDGRLLFASTPLDNPGLDIRAVRKLNPNATIDEGQEVGLQITGTAQKPTLTVFSNPVMEQSDALSYLITGKPLSQVNSGEGDTVDAAAQALGSAAGNLLAKRIGAHLGVDEIGVSSNQALGGTSAFTVGKYLSPRLFISYGVGLFQPGQVITLRYRINHRWSLEAQNATQFNRASLNYRIER